MKYFPHICILRLIIIEILCENVNVIVENECVLNKNSKIKQSNIWIIILISFINQIIEHTYLNDHPNQILETG